MWPKRMSVDQFIRDGFLEDSRPDKKTIKNRIKRGEIPGELHGNRYYVFVGPNGELMAPAQSPGNALTEAVLAEWTEDTHGSEEAA